MPVPAVEEHVSANRNLTSRKRRNSPTASVSSTVWSTLLFINSWPTSTTPAWMSRASRTGMTGERYWMPSAKA
ncbi:hypothetical protein ColKHC_08036 [Colletotrichum higginsianum]|nr:hypothetical protein ColKHC_08036 [Colletotrichum higginsianum]